MPRAINDVPARPGLNGKPQRSWLGGGFSRYLVDLGGWPGWHISGDWPSAGFQAYYPAAKSRVSADIFLKQASAAVQLVNTLMVKDVIALAPAWGYLQVAVLTLDDKAFAGKADSASARAMLSRDFDGIFALVKTASYEQVLALLPAMATDADKVLAGKAGEPLQAAILAATRLAERGVAWKARGLERKADGR